MSPSEPPIRISEPRASRYAFETHCCAGSPPPRAACSACKEVPQLGRVRAPGGREVGGIPAGRVGAGDVGALEEGEQRLLRIGCGAHRLVGELRKRACTELAPERLGRMQRAL